MDRIGLSLIFGAGIVVQTLLFVFNSGAQNRGGRLAAAAGAGLVGLLPGKHERDYQLHFHLCYCFIVYALVVFSLFKKEIMARVGQSNLLVNSLTFWYLCASFLSAGDARLAVMALAALPTLGTLIVAFTIRDWSFPVRLSCYVWFLVLTVALSIFQIRFGDLSFVVTDSYSAPDAISLYLTGMAVTYLMASLFYIYILIPIADKHQTQEQRMEIWRQDAHLMAGCFVDYRMTATEAFLIIALQGGLYALNAWGRWISPGLMMNVSFIALPFVFQRLFQLAGRVPTPDAAVPQP
jgi:hypothetical protein